MERQLAGNRGTKAKASRGRERLTGEQLEIVEAVLAGHSTREIAIRFCTSEAVIRRQLGSIYQRLGVSGPLGLALLVMDGGLPG